MERVKRILGEIGIEPQRLEMFNLSSAEGPRFAQIVKEMYDRVAPLGLSPLRSDDIRMDAGIAEMSAQAAQAIEGGTK